MNRYCNPPTKATYRSPVYDVKAVPVEKVVANSYNPNVVAPPEMKLLELSIWGTATTATWCSSGRNASTNGRGACCPWQ